jgi:hypothetical protein
MLRCTNTGTVSDTGAGTGTEYDIFQKTTIRVRDHKKKLKYIVQTTRKHSTTKQNNDKTSKLKSY